MLISILINLYMYICNVYVVVLIIYKRTIMDDVRFYVHTEKNHLFVVEPKKNVSGFECKE